MFEQLPYLMAYKMHPQFQQGKSRKTKQKQSNINHNEINKLNIISDNF